MIKTFIWMLLESFAALAYPVVVGLQAFAVVCFNLVLELEMESLLTMLALTYP